MKSLTVSGYFCTKSFRNAKLSMIKSGYVADDTRTWPSVRALALLSQGSQVTATSIFDATNAAPAAPDVILVSLTSDRCMPFFSRTWARTACIRSEEHTSELQSPCNLVCRLLLEK